MGQIGGSGTGHHYNFAMVDNSVDSIEDGRLWVSSSGTSSQLYDDITGPALIDNATFALATIDYEHLKIHSGDSFVAGSEADVPNAGSIVFLLQTGSTLAYPHIFLNINTEAEASMTLCENAIASSSGTELGVYNRNRTSPNLPDMKVFYQPTISAVGSCLQHKHWGEGKSAGGAARSQNEWILTSGTGYVVILQNETVSSNVITHWINWYEHADRE